jgi:PPOX class probable F420-dependent enzyme
MMKPRRSKLDAAEAVARTYHPGVIDESTDFGARAARHLRDEIVVWLTTVSPRGAPLPMPVWFVWDGDRSVRIYSQPGARVRNLEANARVSLNFPGDGRGGDIVVLSGTATLARDGGGADKDAAYIEKYTDHIARIGHTPLSFAEHYSVPVTIELDRLRGH